MIHIGWPPIVIGSIFVVGGVLVVRFRATVARCIPDFSPEHGMRAPSTTSVGRLIAARILGAVLILAGVILAASGFVRF